MAAALPAGALADPCLNPVVSMMAALRGGKDERAREVLENDLGRRLDGVETSDAVREALSHGARAETLDLILRKSNGLDVMETVQFVEFALGEGLPGQALVLLGRLGAGLDPEPTADVLAEALASADAPTVKAVTDRLLPPKKKNMVKSELAFKRVMKMEPPPDPETATPLVDRLFEALGFKRVVDRAGDSVARGVGVRFVEESVLGRLPGAPDMRSLMGLFASGLDGREVVRRLRALLEGEEAPDGVVGAFVEHLPERIRNDEDAYAVLRAAAARKDWVLVKNVVGRAAAGAAFRFLHQDVLDARAPPTPLDVVESVLDRLPPTPFDRKAAGSLLRKVRAMRDPVFGEEVAVLIVAKVSSDVAPSVRGDLLGSRGSPRPGNDFVPRLLKEKGGGEPKAARVGPDGPEGGDAARPRGEGRGGSPEAGVGTSDQDVRDALAGLGVSPNGRSPEENRILARNLKVLVDEGGDMEALAVLAERHYKSDMRRAFVVVRDALGGGGMRRLGLRMRTFHGAASQSRRFFALFESEGWRGLAGPEGQKTVADKVFDGDEGAALRNASAFREELLGDGSLRAFRRNMGWKWPKPKPRLGRGGFAGPGVSSGRVPRDPAS